MTSRLLRVAIANALVVATASCAVHAAPALPTAPAESLGLSQAALDQIALSFEPLEDTGKVGGVYVVIARHGNGRRGCRDHPAGIRGAAP